MIFNIQLFAKRGTGSGIDSAGGGNGTQGNSSSLAAEVRHREFVAASGGVIENEEPRHIESTYRRNRTFGSGYDDKVLEAKADSNGNVTFSYAKAEFSKNDAPSNVKRHVSYDVVAGALNGKTFNINWNKVNSINGETYDLREQAKAAGLKWDGKLKKWKR